MTQITETNEIEPTVDTSLEGEKTTQDEATTSQELSEQNTAESVNKSEASNNPMILDILKDQGIDTELFKELLEKNIELPQSMQDKLDHIFGQDFLAQYKQGIHQTQALEKEKEAAELKRLQNHVGGEDNYQKILDYAENNLMRDDIDAFNAAWENAAPGLRDVLLDGLHYRMQKQLGTPEKMQQSPSGTSSITKGMVSEESIKEMMRDPRYQTDPAFQSNVMNKIRDLTTTYTS